MLGATALVETRVWPSWAAQRGAGYMVRIFIREQAPSGKRQAAKKDLTGYWVLWYDPI